LPAPNDPPDHLLDVQTLFFDHRSDLFARKTRLHLSVLLLDGPHTNQEEF
jgi:hypothetical protein